MNLYDYSKDITTMETLTGLPAIMRQQGEETRVLHTLERDFKRPGVYKRPVSNVRFVLEWASLCVILLCLMFALAIGTVLSPAWHFRNPLEPAPTPTQVQCVHVLMVTDDNVHWTPIRDYHCP